MNCSLCQNEIKSEPDESMWWATMIDSKRFHYGIMGGFEFVENLDLKAEDTICIHCLEKHAYKALLLACAACHKEYERFEFPDMGAWGCAGRVSGDLIQTGFGSKFDGDKFEIKEGQFPQDGWICDCCIEKEALVCYDPTKG